MLRIALQTALFLALALPAAAGDWVANRLRGTVEHFVHGHWIPLFRGELVLDGAQVRTGQDGRVDLVRGAEVIALEPGTRIELHEGQGNVTSVEMASGTLTADVERRNVQHFSVQTTYLAAIVKGTRFTISVGGGTAQVSVNRGTVQVQDTINDLVADIVRGQEAQVSPDSPLEIGGPGAVAVYTFEGERVVNGTADVPADDQGRPENASNGGNNGNGGNSGNGGNGGNGGNNDDNGNNGNNGNSGNSGNGGNNGNSGNNGNGGNNDDNGNGGNGGNSGNNGNNGNGGNGGNGGGKK